MRKEKSLCSRKSAFTSSSLTIWTEVLISISTPGDVKLLHAQQLSTCEVAVPFCAL
jgi:hypothetical protein